MPIELKNLTYTYCSGTAFESTAVGDVSLKIEDGEFIGLMGHTGCGKSTLIQLMAGLLTPRSGQVLLDGEDINTRRYDRRKLRSRVGVVFQYPEYQLFETTVEKDVTFSLKHSGMSGGEKKKAAADALEKVGFDFEKIADKSPLEFSGGEKRRIAIAGVLAAKPGILILDEPIAGLDPLGRKAFLDMVEALSREGVTIIMISHNADALAEYASRIIAMEDGHVLKDGTVEEIFSDTELLGGKKIGVPQSCRTAELLRQRGVDIPVSAVRYEQLIDAVAARYGRCGK